MAVVNIAQFEDSLVLHFEVEQRRINAYTLASTLIAIADAAKAANAAINPGYELEVVVEAISAGSFRATIRALYSKRGIFAAQALASIALGIVTSYIYERTLAVDNTVKIEVTTDEVVVQRGNDRVIVPRNVYDATRQAEKHKSFTSSVSRVLGSIAKDDNVIGLGLLPNPKSSTPEIIIPRSSMLAASLQDDDIQHDRVVTEIADLQIVKAILDKSKRKWEFMWRGFKISAPVIDDQFYKDFFAHNITIAPGDVLNVTLHILQQRDEDTGIYRNVGYEVVTVHSHTPRVTQMRLADQL
ncbi:MAG: hypothetical protein J0H27_00750 [Xanthomonadales bacterium]|nr:hypothetical protein [Xanthomonadales bacterium]OJY82683.1 MAG: hypothetical protein BGP23_06055 [Xanthomonadales bacterium 66-474]